MARKLRLLDRPGLGELGKACQVRANHFLVEIEERYLYLYDVSFTPEVYFKKTNRDAIEHLFNESHFGKRRPAYDGMKRMYTAGPLPFVSKEFVIQLVVEDGSKREFKVAVKLANKPYLFLMQGFLRSKQDDLSEEAIHVLNAVLKGKPPDGCTVVGRSVYSPEERRGLGNGVEYWRGFYQSLRPTQFGLSLNIDVLARPFYEPVLVSEFVDRNFGYRNMDEALGIGYSEVTKVLKGLKVALTYRDNKAYRITGLSTEPLSQLMFTLKDKKTRTSVAQYYHERYNIVLTYVDRPALQVGSNLEPIYLPMELCFIVAGQRYSKNLNTGQVIELLRANCDRPQEREFKIMQMLKKNNSNRGGSLDAVFGMQVREEMALVHARVLPPPLLKYRGYGREAEVTPQMGKWSMIDKKMFHAKQVHFWAFVNFSDRTEFTFANFIEGLVKMCNSKGMHFASKPLLAPVTASPLHIEPVLRDIHREYARRRKDLQLLIVILPDVAVSWFYGRIKRICETELGIVSQCCTSRTALSSSMRYLGNLALKINVKVGGTNTVLMDAIRREIPLVTDVPTIIIGADVSHPQPGEDSSPSIAAVVASMDWPEISKYRGLVSAQAHREEIIQDLYNKYDDPLIGWVHGGMIRTHLEEFYSSTGQKPRRIIFYRDGVSEGQFSQVLLYEMDAIRKACASLEEEYMPRVTFVVVQKRHHTRLFPTDYKRRDQMDESGNIQPGTVVDTTICHSREFDFYLNSHAGIKGTSRPAHYHVLYDENRVTADELQSLTYNLCYTYARCTRSVSIVPPVYYAHLAATRARYYIEKEYPNVGSTTRSTTTGSTTTGFTATTGSTTTGSTTTGFTTTTGSTTGDEGEGVLVRALPQIKKNVKDVMFYC